jgi:hypothetical protein
MRSRRHERGAATTEGLIVSMFLIACFALSIYVYQRYALALGVSSQARASLWARVSTGCEDGEIDGRLRGAYPRYESRQERFVPVYTSLHDTPRIRRELEYREARGTTSPYLGSREYRYATLGSTSCNETPDFPEDDLAWASVDTWCRVSSQCNPEDAARMAGGGREAP